MKHLPTTLLGIITIVASFFMVFLHMYYSTMEFYELQIEWWMISLGFLKGLVLILFSPKDIKGFIRKYIKKKTSE